MFAGDRRTISDVVSVNSVIAYNTFLGLILVDGEVEKTTTTKYVIYCKLYYSFLSWNAKYIYRLYRPTEHIDSHKYFLSLIRSFISFRTSFSVLFHRFFHFGMVFSKQFNLWNSRMKRNRCVRCSCMWECVCSCGMNKQMKGEICLHALAVTESNCFIRHCSMWIVKCWNVIATASYRQYIVFCLLREMHKHMREQFRCKNKVPTAPNCLSQSRMILRKKNVILNHSLTSIWMWLSLLHVRSN